MISFPKPRPTLLDKAERDAAAHTKDLRESVKARQRAAGRCEIYILGEGRCARRDFHTHHLIGGWGLRGKGKSALAKHKQRACPICHREITGHVLVLRKPAGQLPVWYDAYERIS